MEENTESLSDNFKKELDAVSSETILDPAYRKKKLIMWCIRNTIMVVLYIIFWKHNWVKWSLLLTVPMSLFSLFTITVSPYLLNKKIASVNRKIEEAESTMKAHDDAD